MLNCDYRVPETVAEACALMHAHETARILAGGTDLMVLMRAGKLSPDLIVDIKKLPLDYMSEEQGGLRIGATTRHADIAAHGAVQARWPALAAACRAVGGLATRHRGTLGGNVMNASPVADTVPVLLAYDAVAQLSGLGGERAVPLADFFAGYRSTVLERGEILTGLFIPSPSVRSASSFYKKGKRRALYIASVNLALRIDLADDGVVQTARIALGSVAATSILSRAAADLLEGRPFDESGIEAAASKAAETITPISDVRSQAWYRTRLTETLVRRGLTELRERLVSQSPEGA